METLDDLIQQHNTKYRSVSIRVPEELFEWLKDMAARMKVSRGKLVELMFNHGYDHFLSQTKNGGNGSGDEVEVTAETGPIDASPELTLTTATADPVEESGSQL